MGDWPSPEINIDSNWSPKLFYILFSFSPDNESTRTAAAGNENAENLKVQEGINSFYFLSIQHWLTLMV